MLHVEKRVIELLIPLLGFIVISTITPGPNNLLLATSGMRFGVRATIPHMFGIHLGVYTMTVLCGLGMWQLLLAVPNALLGMKIFGSLYLVYLAWKIIGFRLTESSNEIDRPMTTVEAGLFQFANPKAWLMTTTGLSLAIPIFDSTSLAVVYFCLVFATLGLACNYVWVLTGSLLQVWLRHSAYRLWINSLLALLTLFTVGMFWSGH